MTSFLERYQQGECEEVWAELQALGEQVRSEPLYADALAVARETMRRARTNIETLIQRLPALGYQFGSAWLETLVDAYIEEHGFTAEELAEYPAIRDDLHRLRAQAHQLPAPFVPPSPDIRGQLRSVEALVGVLPLSLRAWYESVGAVNFVGTPPPAWEPLRLHAPPSVEDYCLLDPLSVMSLRQASHGVRWEFTHASTITQAWLEIGTDTYNKYSISGGGASHMELPNPAMDGPVLLEVHQTTFVNYLRICFRWGGLPGLEHCPEVPRKDLAYLIEGLLPV